MPTTLAATLAMFLPGYAVLQLLMAWAGHVGRPSPPQGFTQVASEILDAVAISGTVKFTDIDEGEESKPNIP